MGNEFTVRPPPALRGLAGDWRPLPDVHRRVRVRLPLCGGAGHGGQVLRDGHLRHRLRLQRRDLPHRGQVGRDRDGIRLRQGGRGRRALRRGAGWEIQLFTFLGEIYNLPFSFHSQGLQPDGSGGPIRRNSSDRGGHCPDATGDQVEELLPH